jgi:hypothetical protein
MNRPAKPEVLALALTALGVTTHVLPHQMGVSTAGAVGMLAAAFLPRRLLLLPVLATLLVSDALTGLYDLLAMSFVYFGHVIAAIVCAPILARRGPDRVIAASIASGVAFYLVSNLTTMAMGYFPNTPAGWLACYVAGLPFLARGIAANLVFGGVAFGLIAIIGGLRADRLASAERN